MGFFNYFFPTINPNNRDIFEPTPTPEIAYKKYKNTIEDPVYVLFQSTPPGTHGLLGLCVFHAIMRPGDVLPHSPWYVEKHSLESYLFKSALWNAEHNTIYGPSGSLLMKQNIYNEVIKDNDDDDWDTKLKRYFVVLDAATAAANATKL